MDESFRHHMIKDHIEVAQLFCTIDGYFNARFERALSNPFVTNIKMVNDGSDRCQICPACDGMLQKRYKRRINVCGAKDILFAVYTSKPKYEIKDLVKCILIQPNIDQRLFERHRREENIPKHEIKLFVLFQLIAWAILILEYEQESNTVIFKAAITEGTSTTPTMFKFQVEDNWKDIPSFAYFMTLTR